MPTATTHQPQGTSHEPVKRRAILGGRNGMETVMGKRESPGTQAAPIPIACRSQRWPSGRQE